jgi:hypothetical protein
MGTSLSIDILLKVITDYLEDNNLKQLDHVYLQLDNVVTNKHILIFGVCSALIMWGIVKKFKISYLIVGHTHEDIDGTIGNAATTLRPEDVYSLSNMNAYLAETYKNLACKHFRFKVNVGCMNYEPLLEIINKSLSKDVPNKNIATMREIRLTASADLKSVEMLYTDDSTKGGWYPRGISDYSDMALVSQKCKHPLDPSIEPDAITYGPSPCLLKGHRDEWICDVRFKDSTTQRFFTRCDPILFTLPMEEFMTTLKSCEMQQPYVHSSGKVSSYAHTKKRDEELSMIHHNLIHMNAPPEQYAEEVGYYYIFIYLLLLLFIIIIINNIVIIIIFIIIIIKSY